MEGRTVLKKQSQVSLAFFVMFTVHALALPLSFYFSNYSLEEGADSVLGQIIRSLLYPIALIISHYNPGEGSDAYFGQLISERFLFCWMPIGMLITAAHTLTLKSIKIKSCSAIIVGAVMAFILWCVLSLSWSVNHFFAIADIRVILFYASLVFYVWHISTNLPNGKKLLLFIGFVNTAGLALNIIYAYYLHGHYVPYITLTMNRSLLSEVLCAFVPFMFCVRINNDTLRHQLIGILGLLGYVAVLVMGQRAPVYGLWFATFFIFGLSFLRFPSRRMHIARMALVVLLLSAYFLLPHKGTGKLVEGDTTRRIYNFDQAADTFSYRIAGIITCKEQFLDNMLLGTGYGTFHLVFPKYHAKAMEDPSKRKYSKRAEDHIFSRAHCEPAQIAGETGIIGFLLWALVSGVIPLWLIFKGLKSKNILLIGAGFSLLSISISSLASSFGTRTITSGTFYFFALALYATLPASQYRFTLRRGQWFLASFLFLLVALWVWNSFRPTWDSILLYNKVTQTRDDPKATYKKEMLKYGDMAKMDPANGLFSYAAANTMAAHLNLGGKHSAKLWKDAQMLGYFSTQLVLPEAHAHWLHNEKFEALKTIDYALKVYPDSWVLLSFRAAYMDGLQMDGSHVYWQKAQKIDPNADVLKKYLPGIVNGQKMEIDRSEILKLPPTILNVLGVLYANSTQGQHRFPQVYLSPEKPPWE